MRKITAVLFIWVIALSSLFAQNIVFVNPNATGNKTGSSWQNAYTHLVDAVNNASPNSEIWASNSSPLIVTKNNLKTDNIVLAKKLKLYGGFAGTETNKSQRAPTAQTIISGEIGTIDIQDNSLNAFVISAEVTLDGFDFQYFNSYFDNLTYYGVLVADTNALLTLENVGFHANQGKSQGSCVSALKNASVIANTLLVENNNLNGLGALFSRSNLAKLDINHSNFYGNGSGDGFGYVFYSLNVAHPSQQLNEQTLLSVKNTRFANNSFAMTYSYFGTNSFQNCEFIINPTSSFTFTHSGDSASFYIDSCSFIGSFKNNFLFAGGLKHFEFTNSTFSNPLGDKTEFFDLNNCAQVSIRNSTFDNIQGSIPFNIYSPNGNVLVSSSTFQHGGASSYYFYITAKKFVCQSTQFLNLSTELGNYFVLDSAYFLKTKFEAISAQDFLYCTNNKSTVFDSCQFSEITQYQSLFTSTTGNTLLLKNSQVNQLSIANLNPGVALLFTNWGGTVISTNTTFKQFFAYGPMVYNSGDMTFFGNLFQQMSTDSSLFVNYNTLRIYNSNFVHLTMPLVTNDSLYKHDTTIYFQMKNSIVYSDSNALILSKTAPNRYEQTISNCFTNQNLAGSNMTNYTSLLYEDLYSTSSSSSLENKGINLVGIPSAPTKDLAGNPRTAFGTIDIGAYEFQSFPTSNEDAILKQNPIICYPNPSKDQVWLELNEPAEIQVINLNGEKVMETSLMKGKNSFSVEALSKGIYLLLLSFDTHQERLKLSKK